MKDKKDPIEALLDDDTPVVVPNASGFMPMPPVGPMAPIPQVNEDTLYCLRGPCKHYLEVIQRFDAGNTVGTLKKEPRLTNRFCTKHDLELTDQVVYECNHWHPIDEEEKLRRHNQRLQYESTKEEGDEDVDN